MKKLIATIALALLCGAGCASVTPPQPYVAADRATKTAAAHYLGITAAEHPELKPGIDDLMESWELRVGNAEAGVWPE